MELKHAKDSSISYLEDLLSIGSQTLERGPKMTLYYTTHPCSQGKEEESKRELSLVLLWLVTLVTFLQPFIS